MGTVTTLSQFYILLCRYLKITFGGFQLEHSVRASLSVFLRTLALEYFPYIFGQRSILVADATEAVTSRWEVF